MSCDSYVILCDESRTHLYPLGVPTTAVPFLETFRWVPSFRCRNVLRRRRRQTADLYEEYSRAAEATEDAAKISPGFL